MWSGVRRGMTVATEEMMTEDVLAIVFICSILTHLFLSVSSYRGATDEKKREGGKRGDSGRM